MKILSYRKRAQAFPLILTLGLASCVTHTTSRAEFLAQLDPTNERIAKYEQVLRQTYKPRVTAQGPIAVNEAVNHARYVDEANDVWQPNALWVKGGDCEDYALAKMFELKAQGVSDTYLAVLTHLFQPKSHAVLLAEIDGGLYALDNQRRSPVPVSDLFHNYRMRYVISAKTGQVFVPRSVSVN